MDNSYFIFSDCSKPVLLKRFHLCTWEFNNSTALVEFGLEIDVESIINQDSVSINLFIPWLNESNKEIKDLYNNLKDSANSKFIFNDSVKNTISLDGGNNKKGVIQEFHNREPLCILPIKSKISLEKRIISFFFDLKQYKSLSFSNNTNIYMRFCLEPEINQITTRKAGINKTTIIYDLKINERRNIPVEISEISDTRNLCPISTCFCLQIIPNDYNLTFYENSLKNVRVLEYKSFNNYIEDKRVKEDELIVVFNKMSDSESFSFFSIFQKERIGGGQFALAILINLVCGFLIYLASRDNSLCIFDLQIEILIAILIMFITFIYFLFPILARLWYKVTKPFNE